MIPATIYSGNTYVWVDPAVPDGATAVQVWFRTNTSGQGVVATGTLGEEGWAITLPGTATTSMTAGLWAYQAIATTPEGQQTYGSGRVEVVGSFAFTGTPSAIDSQTQSEKDLAAVEEAIRTLQSGAQSYTIGTASGGRTFTRPQLATLIAWRDRLLQTVAAERKAAGQGRRDRRILVRF
jgi:hypothetical protein